MFDRIFSAALAFCVLAGGTLAVGSAMLEQQRYVQAVQLPAVQVNGKIAAGRLAQAAPDASQQMQ
jgi:hypothetical protein